jgi:hypothetical protein
LLTGENEPKESVSHRVFLKQTKKTFGSNRNKPKLNLFRLIFGLFRKTTKFLFRFVSVRFGILTRLETTKTNRSVLKQTKKQKKQHKNQGFHETNKKNFGSVCFGVLNPYRNHRKNRNKQICFETNRKNE